MLLSLLPASRVLSKCGFLLVSARAYLLVMVSIHTATDAALSSAARGFICPDAAVPVNRARRYGVAHLDRLPVYRVPPLRRDRVYVSSVCLVDADSYSTSNP